MTLTTLHVGCPCCENPCEVSEGFDGDEVECPTCGWEFMVGPDGEITDDGEMDAEPPFELDDEGEWIREYDEDPSWASVGFEREPDWEAYCPYCREIDEAARSSLTPLEDGEVLCDECGMVFFSPNTWANLQYRQVEEV